MGITDTGLSSKWDGLRHGRRVLLIVVSICAGLQGHGTVQFSVEGKYRVIQSDGLPNHSTGQFPGPGNPNRISAQKYSFRMPVKPVVAESTTALTMSPFGIALNGIVFDPFAAEWWNDDSTSGWQLEPMSGLTDSLGIDMHHAHVQPTGAYHYHGLPTGLVGNLADIQSPVQLGWAADGFPIYAPHGFAADGESTRVTTLRSSYAVKHGIRPGGPGGKYEGQYVEDYEFVAGKGDLDECNGRWGKTPEFPEGTYYYVITEEFPFIPRCYKGTPDASFIRRPGGPGGPGGRGRPGRPGPMREGHGGLHHPPPPPGGPGMHGGPGPGAGFPE